MLLIWPSNLWETLGCKYCFSLTWWWGLNVDWMRAVCWMFLNWMLHSHVWLTVCNPICDSVQFGDFFCVEMLDFKDKHWIYCICINADSWKADHIYIVMKFIQFEYICVWENCSKLNIRLVTSAVKQSFDFWIQRWYDILYSSVIGLSVIWCDNLKFE